MKILSYNGNSFLNQKETADWISLFKYVICVVSPQTCKIPLFWHFSHILPFFIPSIPIFPLYLFSLISMQLGPKKETYLFSIKETRARLFEATWCLTSHMCYL